MLNLLFLLLPGLLLLSTYSSFLESIIIRLAQSLILRDNKPASSSCLVSWSTNSQFFSSMVYGFDMIGGHSMGISSSIMLVLPISVVVWDMMWMYFLLSSSCSWFLFCCGMSTSGRDLDNGLVSGSNYKLVFYGILCNYFAVPHCNLLQLTAWISLHFPAGISIAMVDFWVYCRCCC